MCEKTKCILLGIIMIIVMLALSVVCTWSCIILFQRANSFSEKLGHIVGIIAGIALGVVGLVFGIMQISGGFDKRKKDK